MFAKVAQERSSILIEALPQNIEQPLGNLRSHLSPLNFLRPKPKLPDLLTREAQALAQDLDQVALVEVT